jgi:hypothetical protein
MFVTTMNDEAVSGRVPAEAFALFFGYFLDQGERLRPTILADSGEDGIQQGDGGGIGGPERS